MTVTLTVKTGTINNEEKAGIDLDRILTEEIGYGKYQLKLISLLGLTTLILGLSASNYLFTAARMKTRCLIPECEADDSQGLSPVWISNAVPTDGESFDNCHRFAPLISWNITAGLCPSDLFNRNLAVKCTKYVYEHKNSAVYDFDLACDEWRWYFIGSSQVLGTAISLPVMGFVADRWGRRFALSIACVNYAWINAVLYWSNSYTIFLVGLFVGKLFGGSIFTGCYILVIENVRPKHRMAAMGVVFSCYFLGLCIQGSIAFFEPHWRVLIIIVYLPVSVTVGYFWMIPESARWLISKNRFEEARTNLVEAARVNGRELSEKTLNSLSRETKEKIESPNNASNLICLVFKHKAVLLRCIIVPIFWIATYFVMHGLRISSVLISGNIYINFIASSAVAIPSFWVAALSIDRIGRKPLLFGGFWVSGACLLGYVFVPKGYYGVSLTLYLLGIFCISLTTEVIYMFTCELFPTRYRSRLVSYSSMFGRVGEFIAPMTPAAAAQVWEHLPFVLFAGLSFVSGLLLLLVPETLGSKLPETMEDANNLGRDQTFSVPRYLRRLTAKKHCYSLR